jgi:hypothetical protein
MWADGAEGGTPLNSAALNAMEADIQAALVANNAQGTAQNPITNPAAARPNGITAVWWATPTQPTNWQNGDFWVVTS